MLNKQSIDQDQNGLGLKAAELNGLLSKYVRNGRHLVSKLLTGAFDSLILNQMRAWWNW